MNQLVAVFLLARGGDDAPAIKPVLADHFVADAARGADDQCGWHDELPVNG
jgi:hypothetical protein